MSKKDKLMGKKEGDTWISYMTIAQVGQAINLNDSGLT
jgi:hypothetical protein